MGAAAVNAIEVVLDGRNVRLTSLDRVLWPEARLTKGWMLDAYANLAPVLLPHIRGHPVTMWRYPEGVHRDGWWQNECRGAPGWLPTFRYTASDGRQHRHCVIDDISSLLWLVNLGTVEIHPFPFVVGHPGTPRALMFDLDPGPPAGIRDACRVAMRLRELLQSANLSSFAKTSGVKGLHVAVPLNTPMRFEETKAYARTMAAFLVEDSNGLVVDRQARSMRTGKVLVDWLQNDRFRSTVAPYSLRATEIPRISTPVRWEEVADVAAGAATTTLAFGVDEVLRRIEQEGDHFEPVLSERQTLT